MRTLLPHIIPFDMGRGQLSGQPCTFLGIFDALTEFERLVLLGQQKGGGQVRGWWWNPAARPQ
ncbi:hypothetical protein QTI33_07930 [Variovorax sp. J22P271]|uniref:hypothetical protein n=1 Tax=Variovorax davisae TaxID=3053515 RepID=UPI00257701BD|nr:hypothetical protein [Variovorax sp. J22P271]MDM0032070.1 hypothetical protein [Variovorax sp. J22P271]